METLILSGAVKPHNIPTNITAAWATPPSKMSELEKRLDEGGTLIFDDADLTIGAVNPQANSHLFIAVRQLELRNSRILTNGNSLTIFCQEFRQDNASKIDSFPYSHQKAQLGTIGDDGGEIRIYITSKISEKSVVEMSAQDGGDGADGRNGDKGATGYSGRGARNGSFGTCMRGPGNGGNGGRGQNGAPGSNGAAGGNGGTLRIFFLETTIQPELDVKFTSQPGIGGSGGKGGKGGEGGEGGRGGSGAGNCGGNRGIHGRSGAPGDPGIDGERGSRGEPGFMIIREIKIDEILSTMDAGPEST